MLVIDGQSSTLAQLPSPDPRDHELKLHGEVNCSGPADALPATLSAIALGYPDFELRSAARENKERNHLVPLLAARFKPVAGSFALDKQSATSISALDENFSWQADGTLLGLGSVSADKWLLRAPFWVPKEWDLALHRRQMPLFLNQGYPLTLEEELEFSLSEKGKSVALPAVAENDAEPLRWRIEWTKGTDEKLVVRFRAELRRGDLSDAETRTFQKQLRQLLAALAREAVIPLAGQPKTAARESE